MAQITMEDVAITFLHSSKEIDDDLIVTDLQLRPEKRKIYIKGYQFDSEQRQVNQEFDISILDVSTFDEEREQTSLAPIVTKI